ncbi:hypothetical protein N7471_004190 [Penicillium samsonianum]|uniref:uncharacterized protein n=1 Tax=Penicillium samsonianum TaxID=1882272 RepID=UPI002547311C|nr:uncharacterized protein N7471_004190 [Penicillium samsonianum]KAJ6137704.1 hypothetical protein N7471_004190 [Penicillium samsonianum]
MTCAKDAPYRYTWKPSSKFSSLESLELDPPIISTYRSLSPSSTREEDNRPRLILASYLAGSRQDNDYLDYRSAPMMGLLSRSIQNLTFLGVRLPSSRLPSL